ncbi:GIY-YIG nuclease family protein [Candidatus Dojkabacteria bacterium]|nr:GIY-YIG nuclease family protein [Candidatus Dojkabacteria bacterium]
MHFVYILYSKKLNKFYTGYTQDLKERNKQHSSKEVPFTLRGCPWILVYYEAFLERSDALREEKFLKTGKGRERRGYLLKSLIAKIKS